HNYVLSLTIGTSGGTPAILQDHVHAEETFHRNERTQHGGSALRQLLLAGGSHGTDRRSCRIIASMFSVVLGRKVLRQSASKVSQAKPIPYLNEERKRQWQM